MDMDEVSIDKDDDPNELFDQDGVISEEEFVKAFHRAEHLTTILVNKIMLRFSCACVNILDDGLFM